MATKTIAEVKQEIDTNVNTNGNRSINGAILNTTLNDMMDAVDEAKANTTGYYEGMTVGLADNLRSPDGVDDSGSWLYRSTAGDQDVSSGYANVKSLKGNTIVWNQLMNPNGVHDVYGERGYLYQNGSSIVSFQKDDLFYVKFDYVCTSQYDFTWGRIDLSSGGNTFGGYYEFGVIKDSTPHSLSTILVSNDSSNHDIYVRHAYNQITVPGSLTIDNVNIIDLTKMFGSGNEPSTPEEFEALFTNSYYANQSHSNIIRHNFQYNNKTQTEDLRMAA